MQVNIVKVYKDVVKKVKQSSALNLDEISYINRVFEKLMNDCTKVIDELITVTGDGQLEMKDDERLKRIDDLYADMQDKYSFVQAFSNEAKLLSFSRMQEQNNIQSIRALYSIKK